MSLPVPKIIYTETDEAPALATYSWLPIVQAFTQVAGITVEPWDISLSGRILAEFPDYLAVEQRQLDALAELKALAQRAEANIIKLPNISASIPQLKSVIRELQAKGYGLPDYPDEPNNEAEKVIKRRYDKIKGSAVNPVLREGNSDRRAPRSVKGYARRHPHAMGPWSPHSQSHVASLSSGDFWASEQSVMVSEPGFVRIQWVGEAGNTTVLKAKTALQAGEVIDAAVMSCNALRIFLEREMDDAKAKGVLFSIHLKATMMQVSDPIIFGHAVSVFFKTVFEKHRVVFQVLGVDPNNGLGDLYDKIRTLPEAQQAEIEADIQACYASRPSLAMCDSARGITNLHVPSDIIIDASIPAAIRSSGQMWNSDGELQDVKAVIPDRCYAGVYQAAIEFCKEHGAFDPTTMGSVSNVGLMAQKAEEYGSHDKTFEIAAPGRVQVVDAEGRVLLEHAVEKGDIWRLCQVKDAPIRDWIKLAIQRGRATGDLVVFWLDPQRAHDAQLIEKVKTYLQEHDTSGLDITLKSPVEATRFSLERMKQGQDTISVTGNVLRDYLTDLFPILELGTSAKMLSIVPLMGGGGLFETGAGGSAPKHLRQFQKEGHLRWDSLGEFLALAASLEHLAKTFDNPRAQILAETLDQATSALLENNKSPVRQVKRLDSRGSHFYLTLYWAQALAKQTQDEALRAAFASLAEFLAEHESQIVQELNDCQGAPVELGGYYRFNVALASQAMCPSATFNAALKRINSF